MRGGGVDPAHPAELLISIASATAPSTFLTTQFYRGCRAPCHGAGQSKNPYQRLAPRRFQPDRAPVVL